MNVRKQLAALFVCASVAAGAAQATQTVNFTTITKNTIPTTSPVFVLPGDVIRFQATLVDNTDGGPGMAGQDPRPNDVSSGLGLCLNYNVGAVGNPTISQVLTTQLLAPGAASPLNAMCNQNGGTIAVGADSMLIRGWADGAAIGWPTDPGGPSCPGSGEPQEGDYCDLLPLPLRLYTATYTVPAGTTISGSTQLAFAATSTHEGVEPFSSNSPLVLCQTPTVSVGTPVNGSETGPTAASFTVTLSNAIPAECGTGGLFPVTLTLGGTSTVPGQAGADYAASGAGVSNVGSTVTINFPANGMATSAVVTLTPVNDASVEGTETVTLTAAAGSGNYLGVGANASANITDDDSGVSFIVTTNGGEGGPVGAFTFTRVGDTTGPLTVNFVLSGTAAAGDFNVSNGAGASAATTASITFAAGSPTAVLNINVVDDPDVEGQETLILTISPNAAYGITGTNPQTMNIGDNDAPPVITVSASTNAAEPSTNGSFTVTRSGNLATAPAVNFTVGGTATRGAGNDYTLSTDSCVSPLLGNVLTIPAATVSVTVSICVIDDASTEGTETVTLTVAAGATYTVGAPATQSANITDDDGPVTVTIVATTPAAAEPATNGLFTVTRNGGGAAQLANPLTVTIAITGTASNGTDYTTIPTTVTIPAMSTTATIPVTVIDDVAPESSETVIVTVQAAAGYTPGAPAAATVNIADDDGPVTVTIVATTPSASEPATNGLFTVTRSAGNAAQNMLAYTVNLTITGTAANGTDYTTIPTTVTIPAMTTSVTIPVTVTDDIAPESSETVIVTIQSGANYTVGTPAAATVNIADDDGPITVTIAATTPNASEPSTNGLFTVTRTAGNAAQNMLAYTVNLSIGGTATNGVDYATIAATVTIPAMQTSVTVPVTVTDDTALEASETVVVTVTSGTNYVVGSPSAATVTIADDEIGISVTVIANAVEGGTSGIFRICRTGPTVGALLVTFNVGGGAVEGQDFTLSGNTMNTVTIPDGQSCIDLVVDTINNPNIDGPRDISITLVAGGNAQVVPGQGSAQMAIVDDERPAVIPTMSTLGMLLMGLMLAGIAGFSVRRRRA